MPLVSFVNIGKFILVANLDSNLQMFSSYSVLELDNFDSGFLVFRSLNASTRHDIFLCEKKSGKICSLNVTRSLLKQDF